MQNLKKLAAVVSWVMSVSLASYSDVVLTASVGVPTSGEFTPVTVTAEATGGSEVAAVAIVYRTLAGGDTAVWVTNALDKVGDEYRGEIPPLPVATVEYFATATDAGGASYDTEHASYAAGDVPTTDRYWDFTKGTYVKDTGTPASNYKSDYYYDLGDGRRWTAKAVSISTQSGHQAPGGIAPQLVMRNYPNEAMCNVTSPRLEGGVGTIYFTSKMLDISAEGTLDVQIALVDEPGENDWSTVKSFDFERVTENERLVCHAEPVVLNNYNAKRVRFLRTHANDYSESPTKGMIALDSIAISRPPARVEMEEQLRNPGYPSQDQPVKMRVKVTDVSDDTPTVNRRVTVHYAWTYTKTARPLSTGWRSVVMTRVGDSDVYEGTISTQKVGFINYYYRCDYDGYFYSRDPDGTDGAEILNSENMSPVFWALGETLDKPPQAYSRFEVRPYRSEYERVAMVSEPSSTTVSNMTLVGNETWQCVTLVTGVTNLTWRFVGYNRYTDDAPEFQAEPVEWGENDQAFVNPPLGGYVETAATNGIQAELEYTGFLMMRFNIDTRDYIVKRAVWQDFDEWQASQDYYEESLGLYATTSYSVDFDKWAPDGYSDLDPKGTGFELDEPGEFDDFDSFTYGNWIRSKSRIIAERQVKKDVPGNKAVDLQRGGYIGNSGLSMTYGLSRFSYRVRSSLADDHWALYKNGTTWALPQTITPTFQVIERAGSEHYLGVIFCYQIDEWGEPPGYYELRFIQASCANGNDNFRRVELWRQDPGAEGPVQVETRKWFDDGKLASGLTPEINVSVENGKVVVKVAAAPGKNPSQTFTDANPGALTAGGTVGFGSYDASPEISKLVVKVGDAAVFADSKKIVAGEWYLGGKRLDSPGKTRWEIAGNKLSRAVPTQTLSIYSADQVSGENSPDISKLREKAASIAVSSLEYADKAEVFKAWNRKFVQLRYVSGEGNVVVDDVRDDPWRATSRGEDASSEAAVDGVAYYDWDDVSRRQDVWLAENNGWAILEGWTTNVVSGVGREAILERSRANTNLVQAVVTPVMTNGLGSITFTYAVTGAPGEKAIYSVSRTVEHMINTWSAVDVYTNTVGDAGSRYSKVATPMEGRGRVRIELMPGSGDVALHIDEVIAKDYPPRDKTSWLAYNTRITDTADGNMTLIYNGTGKSAFLNNSTTDGTAGTEVLAAHEPFIQSPEVGTGIGEIAFAYRAYAAGASARIIVKAAPSEDTPEAMWRTVTNFTVTSAGWAQFADPEVFDLEDKVLRVYASTNAANGRFAIDNILVTEPVRASYEISSVRLDPAQPVAGSDTAVEAEIGRFLMNPTDIALYASYHAGTNDWGRANWWTRSDANSVRLFPVGPGSRVYRTADGAGIPAGRTDEVVQYVVWGVHSEIRQDDENVIFQGTNTFANPAWYAPVDLNAAHASEGWTPYYFVYSCAPGCVWINELNYYRGSVDRDTHEYLEIAGPANASIAGWRVEAVDRYGDVIDGGTLDVAEGTVLPNDEDGWGFFVWGSSETPNMDVKMREETDDWLLEKYGGLRLYRSNGALEQKLCWGSKSVLGGLMDEGYEYIQLKGGSTNSLSLVSKVDEESGEYVNGSAYQDFTWVKLGQTPGARNDDGTGDKQLFLPFLAPGGDSFILTSSLTGPGRQNGGAGDIREEVAAGRTASVLYEADEWSRIVSLKANGSPVAAAAGRKKYSYEVSGMSGDVALTAVFGPWTDNGHPDVPVSWLANWREAQIAAGDADSLSVEDEYLLDTDPTQDTTVEFSVGSILVGETGVTLGVTLERADDGVPFTGPVNGLLRIYSAAEPGGVFLPEEKAAKAGAFDGKTVETIELPFTTSGKRFFKARIDAPQAQ